MHLWKYPIDIDYLNKYDKQNAEQNRNKAREKMNVKHLQKPHKGRKHAEKERAIVKWKYKKKILFYAALVLLFSDESCAKIPVVKKQSNEQLNWKLFFHTKKGGKGLNLKKIKHLCVYITERQQAKIERKRRNIFISGNKQKHKK